MRSLLASLAAPARDGTGVTHDRNEPGSRGGFSMYVPEYYAPDRAWPLVMALHGGSGNGRNFLWSWLRDARSFGAILVAPTATGNTWALMGQDNDTPNLLRILETVQGRWHIDRSRLLLTGMSDGGTFCYVSGLDAHLAFHPSRAGRRHVSPAHGGNGRRGQIARLADLPVHGRLDWMFPVQVARQTHSLLSAAGANVTYREIDDLSHTYPREINAADSAMVERGWIAEQSTGARVVRRHRRISNMQSFLGMILGAVLADRRRLHLRFDPDIDGGQRPGGTAPSHSRELGRCRDRLAGLEDACAQRLGPDLVEIIALGALSSRNKASSPSTKTLFHCG